MKLPREGIEYVTWPITGAPTGTTLEARLSGDTVWHPLAWAVEPTEARLLVAGPDAEVGDTGAVQLADQAETTVEIRLVDTPETVIRFAGTITLT